jgi:hypothetical protein
MISLAGYSAANGRIMQELQGVGIPESTFEIRSISGTFCCSY